MAFSFVIRKLNKIMRNEQIIAARGADRFAPGRIVELKEAIQVLTNYQADQHKPTAAAKTEVKRTATLKEFMNQIPLFH